MPKLFRSLRNGVSRYTLDEYAADRQFVFQGMAYGGGATTGWAKSEDLANDFTAYIQSLYRSNGVVYAVIAARRLLFKQARFMWQEQADGRDGDLFWTPDLDLIRRPWPNGTSGELLARMEQDVSLGGNAYVVREPKRLRRLRPDWMTIVLTAPPAEAVESDVAGYWYHPGRVYSMVDKVLPDDEVYLPHEVAHWTPDPDPEAQYRGMSWLQPVVREVLADKAATTHKAKFFENGATLGAIISAKENLTDKQFNLWKSSILEQHSGADRAYKPMFLASPVDVTIQGLDLQQLDFKVTQGHGETRICAAGRVPPIIVGVSEGLEAATYSNYGMARRAFGDGWAHPQWEDVAGALETIFEPPADKQARLWYSYEHIAFLREDLRDAADIQQTEATTIRQLQDAGYTPESVVAAVEAKDWRVLKHSGMFSVQLQPPGSGQDDAGAKAATEGQASVALLAAQMTAVKTGVDAGFDKESVVEAVEANDLGKLEAAEEPTAPPTPEGGSADVGFTG